MFHFHYFTIKFHFYFFASFRLFSLHIFRFASLKQFSLRSKIKRSEIQVYFFAFFPYFSHFFLFFTFFRFKFFASLRFSNFCFEAKQSKAKFKPIFSLFSLFFTFFHFFLLFFHFFRFFSLFFHFFSLNFCFASIFSLNFRLFYLGFRFRFLVFRIEVIHVKSGFFFASKRNEIFASISNFASEAKVRAHPSPYGSNIELGSLTLSSSLYPQVGSYALGGFIKDEYCS